MNLKTAGLYISVTVILASTTLAFAVTPEESLKKNFPNIPVDSITPSNVSGLYEVIAGQQVSTTHLTQNALLPVRSSPRKAKTSPRKNNGSLNRSAWRPLRKKSKTSRWTKR